MKQEIKELVYIALFLNLDFHDQINCLKHNDSNRKRTFKSNESQVKRTLKRAFPLSLHSNDQVYLNCGIF